MNTQTERKIAARAKELGECADPGVFEELAGMTTSLSPLVRRLAASALGKLAGVVPAPEAVRKLMPLLRDEHPQVRQYAAKALGSYGADAKEALHDLRDLYRSSVEKDYVKRSVLKAGKSIRAAIGIREMQREHLCQRCGVKMDHDEFVNSQREFQRSYCGKCFDEVFLQRRNFETKVELQKTIRTRDGCLVQSDGERLIAEALAAAGIRYRYDERFRILDGYAIRPDFYLPEFDVYIEYWGMNTNDYKISMLKKQELYKHQGKKLISIYPKDKSRIAEIIANKLEQLK